jgi:hypothetical protein
MAWKYTVEDRLRELEEKIASLEQQLQSVATGTPTGAAGMTGEDIEKVGTSLPEIIYNLRVLRLSMMQYSKLANELGIPKDIRESMKYFENFTNIMYRTMQLVRMTDMAIKAMEVGMGPMGWAMLAISSGGYAASLMVSGMRFMGGK